MVSVPRLRGGTAGPQKAPALLPPRAYASPSLPRPPHLTCFLLCPQELQGPGTMDTLSRNQVGSGRKTPAVVRVSGGRALGRGAAGEAGSGSAVPLWSPALPQGPGLLTAESLSEPG